MRIKIIGDNNCARATRHLLRLAGFAVTEFLPGDAVAGGPLAGYAITIDLAPATPIPDAYLRPDSPTQQQHASASEEAARSHRDASLPSTAETTTSEGGDHDVERAGLTAVGDVETDKPAIESKEADESAVAAPKLPSIVGIHFDSVDSALEAAVLRHVSQLAAAPVIVDRPGGVVHSDRELRIVAPNTGDAQADEAAAVAIEFGVLRGLLDLSAPAYAKASAGLPAEAPATSRGVVRKKWWVFGVLLLLGALGIWRASVSAAGLAMVTEGHSLKPVPLKPASIELAPVASIGEGHRLKPVPLMTVSLEPVPLAAGLPQGQFDTGQGIKITDGNNFFVVDPCKGQTKSYASINQTANAQLVAGTASKKIYVCSIHVVAAAAADVAVVEGTGSVCGTSTAGVSGFGGATAATGWNFAANGGIALGNGDSSLGAEGTSGDNLCIFNSGSGQVSGGISYVVE